MPLGMLYEGDFFSKRVMRRVFAALLLSILLYPAANAEELPIQYRVGTDQLKNHRLTVEAEFPPTAFSTKKRELALAVWTPGSYKVRDYSRFLSTVEVLNPGARITKSAKNRWLVEGVPNGQPVKVAYSVYGHELTVRTNYFTPELTLVVGAATFLAPAPLRSELLADIPCEVSFSDPALKPSTGLQSLSPTSFRAENYDELADCPILLGDLENHSFQAGNAEHILVQAGDRRYWDTEKSLEDTQKLVEAIQKLWGSVPYDRYLFQNLITDTRGGLEHRNSTVVMTKRFATKERELYVGWLSLLSHEFFHTWNVKRLRPDNLGPFDYEREVYTRSLWIAEGITSYYDDLMVRRAGLSTRDEYLEALSDQLNRLLTTPGRQSITLSDASFDTWIRLYQPTDDLHNSNISYYNKGAVVAWLLDTELQKRTDGKVTLDDVMRAAYKKFRKKGFKESEFRRLVSKVAGQDFSDFFAATLDSTKPLPIQPALEYWDLTWKPNSSDETPYLGLEASDEKGRIMVSKVMAGSPAAKAGIAPGDELLAIDGRRLPNSSPLGMLKHLKQGSYEVFTSRLGRIRSVRVNLAASPHRKSSLTFSTKPDSGTESRWNRWLGPERSSES